MNRLYESFIAWIPVLESLIILPAALLLLLLS